MDGPGGIDTHWLWATLGLVLLAAEMLLPGVFLLWFGLAALVTAVLVFATDPSVPVQVVNFVTLSLIFAYSAKRWLADRPIESSDPLLNNRIGRMVGETAVVTLPSKAARAACAWVTASGRSKGRTWRRVNGCASLAAGARCCWSNQWRRP
jgi:membrane protein implicated in regulation of membrane protease activity